MQRIYGYCRISTRQQNIKKKAPAKKIIAANAKEFGGTLTDTQCAAAAGISRKTFYKYKAELREELYGEGIQTSFFYAQKADVSNK